jgi:hypothetical protein
MDCLSLSRKPGAFDVREAASGTSNASFSYRVVARRTDVDRALLEDVARQPSLVETPSSLRIVPAAPRLEGILPTAPDR